MTTPAPNVYIAFASTIFDSPQVWTDVSNDVMKVSIRRGRQYELNRMEAGTAIINLRNLHANYWPDNSTSGYYPNVRPCVMIKVEVTYGGTTYPRFLGYVEQWTPDFILKPIKAPIMVLSCVELSKSLNQFLINHHDIYTYNLGWSSELSGTRMNNLLTAWGWPNTATTRNIDAGQSNVIATGIMANQNALSHAYDIQESEDGLFFWTPDGRATYQDRHHRNTATSAATFSDNSTNRYYTINLSRDEKLLFNQARVTRNGGTFEQIATNTTSKDRDGIRVLNQNSALLTNDAECNIKANWYVAKYKDSTMRVESLTIRAESDQANLYPQVFGRGISDRITIALTQASLSKDYFIEGIQQDWDVLTQIWETTWQLSDANWYNTAVPMAQEILRPFASTNNLNNSTAALALGDNLDSTLVTNSTWGKGLFSNTTEYTTGTINSVKFVWRVSGNTTGSFNAGIGFGGAGFSTNNYQTISGYVLTSTIEEVSYTYTQNPYTSTSWAWADVNPGTPKMWYQTVSSNFFLYDIREEINFTNSSW